MAIPSSVFVSPAKRCFRFCTFQLGIQLIMALSTGSSHWVGTQSVMCRFTQIWAALAQMAASWTCLCISSSVSATTGSWAFTLPVNLMVTPSRMDFTVSMYSLNVTWLRASAAALPCPFWYSMLKVNPVSNSTWQCWVASKFSVVMVQVSGLLLLLTRDSFRAGILETNTWVLRQAFFSISKAPACLPWALHICSSCCHLLLTDACAEVAWCMWNP